MIARIVLLLLLLLTALAAGPVAAEDFARVGNFGPVFAHLPVDARGEAMGLATTVDPSGPTAFWWNPAPLPESDRVMVSYTLYDHPLDLLDWRPLAIRASRGNLTFGYLWGRGSTGPVLVRTAYDPDGNGATIEYGADLHLFGFAADLAAWIAGDDASWRWTLGATVHHQREHIDGSGEPAWDPDPDLIPTDVAISAWDADLGTTLAWRAVDAPEASLQLLGTFTVRNLLRSDWDVGPSATPLPRSYHLGVGLEAGLGARRGDARLVQATASYAWRRDLEDIGWPRESEHLGLELLVAGLFAARAGHRTDDKYRGEGWSLGAGLRYRFDAWWGIRAAVDYARFAPDRLGDLQDPDAQEHWTFTAGVDLP